MGSPLLLWLGVFCIVFVILDDILYSKLRGVYEGPMLASLFSGSDISQIVLVVILRV